MRAGATLLFESDPDAEEAETRLKASALLDAINRADDETDGLTEAARALPGRGKRVLMVDHEDSFVHTLAGYFRQTGAEVVTYRCGFTADMLKKESPDLVLLSPGPGRPEDFQLADTIRMGGVISGYPNMKVVPVRIVALRAAGEKGSRRGGEKAGLGTGGLKVH